jgi:hypothetical protein
MLWMIFLFYLHISTALTVYNNARFEPNNIYFNFANITQVASQIDCACLCYSNSMCVTATYFGIAQRCTFSLAPIVQSILRLTTSDTMTSVLTFENRTISGKSSTTTKSA